MIMLLGHWQEMAAIGQARGAVGALADSCPTKPNASRNGGIDHVSLASSGWATSSWSARAAG